MTGILGCAEENFSDDGSSTDLRPVKVSTISFVDLAGSERGSVAGQESPMERVRQSEVLPFPFSSPPSSLERVGQLWHRGAGDRNICRRNSCLGAS